MPRNTHSLPTSPPNDNPQTLAFPFCSTLQEDTFILPPFPTKPGPPLSLDVHTWSTETPSRNSQIKPIPSRLASLPTTSPPRDRGYRWKKESLTPPTAWLRRTPSSRPTLQCTSSCILNLPGSQSLRRFSWRSQCFCSRFVNNTCMCSQLTHLSAPTCKLIHSIGSFSSCSISTNTVVYHLENTLNNAIARNSCSLLCHHKKPQKNTKNSLSEIPFRHNGHQIPMGCKLTGWPWTKQSWTQTATQKKTGFDNLSQQTKKEHLKDASPQTRQQSDMIFVVMNALEHTLVNNSFFSSLPFE